MTDLNKLAVDSHAAMARRVNALETENAQLRAELAECETENAELLAVIKHLKTRLGTERLEPLREQEPVAWLCETDGNVDAVVTEHAKETYAKCGRKITPLYTAPQPAIPEGYVLVPVEPTQEMLDVILNTHDVYGFAADLYKALLDAAKETPNA
jgi:regulator of replication initiation timing